jgi:hypothetical protein
MEREERILKESLQKRREKYQSGRTGEGNGYNIINQGAEIGQRG